MATAAFWSTFYHGGKIVPVEGARPPPFIILTITCKVAVFAPAEWADTLNPISSYQYMYSVVTPTTAGRSTNLTFPSILGESPESPVPAHGHRSGRRGRTQYYR